MSHYASPEDGAKAAFDDLRIMLKHVLPRRGAALDKSLSANRAFLLSRRRAFIGGADNRACIVNRPASLLHTFRSPARPSKSSSVAFTLNPIRSAAAGGVCGLAADAAVDGCRGRPWIRKVRPAGEFYLAVLRHTSTVQGAPNVQKG